MDRAEELEAAATAAGLSDLDLLRIAKAEMSPGDAVQDLVRRFPSAFGAAQPAGKKSVYDMTPAELEAFYRKNGLPVPRANRLAPR